MYYFCNEELKFKKNKQTNHETKSPATPDKKQEQCKKIQRTSPARLEAAT